MEPRFRFQMYFKLKLSFLRFWHESSQESAQKWKKRQIFLLAPSAPAIFYFVAHFGARKHVLLALPTDFRNALTTKCEGGGAHMAPPPLKSCYFELWIYFFF